MKVVGICGSLRAGSSNSVLLHAAAALAPAGMTVQVFEGIGGLPHFNPDLDTDAPPETVRAFRALLASAQAVLISSPEYAHGVPGTLKNALDWIVSSGELMDKPVALLNASAGGGEFANPALIEILRTMSAKVATEACLLAGVVRRRVDVAAAIEDPEIAAAVRSALAALAASLTRRG
jgi:NAD(P)H-dependent FMN reductase